MYYLAMWDQWENELLGPFLTPQEAIKRWEERDPNIDAPWENGAVIGPIAVVATLPA